MTALTFKFSKIRGHGLFLKVGAVAVALLICNILLGYYTNRATSSINLLDFFPDAGSDGSRITWAHSTNSKHSLKEALMSKMMVLEADVSKSSRYGRSVPIMGHPPSIVNDLTLDHWLAEVSKFRKGVKLNFQHIDVVEPAIQTVKKHITEIKFPVLLCADILQGPTNTISLPLKASRFLSIGKQLPSSILSLGWTTFLDPNVPFPAYTRLMVDEMINVLKSSDVAQSVTFSVRACMAKNSVDQLKHLLASVPGSTLTVWSSQGDPISAEDLIRFRRHFDIKRVYYDLCSPLREEFLQSISRNELR